MKSALRAAPMILLALLSLAVASCGGGDGTSTAGGESTSSAFPREAVVVGAAGDIACDPSFDSFDPEAASEYCGQLATSDALVELDPDAVLALGDLQYPDGELKDFRKSYDPSWGRLIDRTHAIPGNHEYNTEDAAGYFDYLEQSGAPSAGPRKKGYYALDLGDWRVLALNTNCEDVACEEGSKQYEWLERQLESTNAECVLAMSHQPRFSSGPHGSSTVVEPLWDLLHRNGADVVLSGHDHIYERFAPQTPSGLLDEDHGVTQFVVGTGGGTKEPLAAIEPNSQFQKAELFGVLELALGDGEYGWRFLPTPIEGEDMSSKPMDQGVASCVSPGGEPAA